MTKCYFCGGAVKKQRTNIARYWGKELIALKAVPVLVCTKCGERFFEAKVSKVIDEKIQKALKNKTTQNKINVPVVQF